MFTKTVTKTICLTALIVCIAALPAQAKDKIKRLDKDNITKFVEETTALTNGQKKELPEKEVKRYLDRHLHKQGRYISQITYVVPGFEPQGNVISLDKNEFIDTVAQGAETVENYENSVEIISIDISTDKRKATVLTSGTEQGMMEVQPDQAVPMMGKSYCTQILMLSDDDILQMFHAKCETNIEFQGF